MQAYDKSQYSLFTDALVRVLREGTVESRKRGFITIEQAVAEANGLIADVTRRLSRGHEMNAQSVKFDRSHKGSFVFLHPHVDRAVIPEGDVRAMGIAVPKGAGDEDFRQHLELVVRRAYTLAMREEPPIVRKAPYIPKLEESDPRQGFIERRQYELLLAELPDSLKALFVCGYHVGCRKNELRRLRWEQVDLEAGLIALPGLRPKTKHRGPCRSTARWKPG